MSKCYYTTVEAAELLGLSKFTLIKWRSTGAGPKWFKFGGSVRYGADGIAAFLQQTEKGGC